MADLQKDLCLFIPTRNHAQMMNYFMNSVLKDCELFGIDIVVYDSSNNRETEKVLQSFESDHIHYVYCSSYQDKTTDKKVVDGLKELKKYYKYIWLCGDGYIPFLQNIFPKIRPYMEECYDIMHFNFFDKIYKNNITLFFKECGVRTTCYGASIISSKLFDCVDLDDMYVKLKNSGFLYWSSIFQALPKLKNPKFVSINRTDTFIYSPLKKVNSSNNPNTFFYFWVNKWPYAVYNLPSIYDDYKDDICLSQGILGNFYSWKGLLRRKLTGNLSLKMIFTHKHNLKKVTKIPLWHFYLIALLPLYMLKRIVRIFFKRNAA